MPRSLLFLLAIPVFAQPPDRDQKISEAIAQALKNTGAPSVSVAVIENGKLVYARAAGKANIEANRAADEHTRYAVGSISKQFTAASLLLLQEQHKISLDDKVSKYFPELTRANEITIRQLLTHTAGYEDFAPQDYIIPEWLTPTTPRAVLDRWAKKPLNFDPGTRWQYSNTNYVLAGQIFEKASGQTLLAFLAAKIFNPLGMHSAGECTTTSPADATAYTRYALGPPRPVAREASGWYFAAGELCMTPSDLARWDMAFLQKKILSAKSYEEFTHEVHLKNSDGTGYALGLQIGSFHHIPTISHGGEVSGFLALNTLYPTRNGAVITLSNEDGIQLIGPLAQQIATIMWIPSEPSPATSEQDTAEAKSILEGLERGEIDRQKLTANAISYFTAAALADFKSSLSPLGNLQSVTRTNEVLRGGMTFRSYRAQFEKKSVIVTVYVTSGGKYEQYMVLEES